jgi:hypothetical protein
MFAVTATAVVVLGFWPLAFPLTFVFQVGSAIAFSRWIGQALDARHEKVVGLIRWDPRDGLPDDVLLYFASFPGDVQAGVLLFEPFADWCRLFHTELEVSLAASLARSQPDESTSLVFDVAAASVR